VNVQQALVGLDGLRPKSKGLKEILSQVSGAVQLVKVCAPALGIRPPIENVSLDRYAMGDTNDFEL
jgi:hypothetical protein